METDLRRRLPSVDQLLHDASVRALEDVHGHSLVVREARLLIEEARGRAAAGDEAGLATLVASLPAALAARLEAAREPSLVRVINATGVVIHTNLGRAPLPAAAAARVAEIAASYTNLELDLASGERGDRELHTETRLRQMLGSEAAVVVNNNAAAVLLAVNTFAEGKDVLVSRGELVEIGGSFRIPDVLRKGGARLREVGTTNRTRLADYRAALSGDTGMILKVHRSNFRIVGFTEEPSLEALIELAHAARIPLVEDLGSGLLAPVDGPLAEEPVAARSLAAGADVVTFSGDKLLGGPQAGLVVGRRAALEPMRANPLYRALRVDKMTVAALDVVLGLHERGRGAEDVPVLRMLALSAASVGARAEALAAWLRADAPALAVDVVEGVSAVGGGAAPEVEIPSVLVRLGHPSLTADGLARVLREGQPPVVGRIANGRVVLDLRTVAVDEEPALREALRRAAAQS